MTEKQSDPGARPLPVLRAMIDVVDREMLELLARRNAIVGEVASFKRSHSVGIRDRGREREIIDDRRARSEPLGLRPQVVESIFRLVMAASRDRQAELKAQVPLDVVSKSIAIIGGKGGMGQCMARLFGDLGHAVMIADVDTALTPSEAAGAADVVVISVPIDVTTRVIEQIGSSVKPEALLMDLTSIKTDPVEAMLKHSSASVIGAHPLFGPSVHTLQGQRMVLTPARPGDWLDWLETMLTARGLVIHRATPEEHDRAMSIVQVLTHFATEVMGRALTDLHPSIEETLAFTSPVYQMELYMTARHFAQSPDLYASIQMSNPECERITSAFVDAASRLKNAVDQGDRESFATMFNEVSEYLGAFKDEAMEQSSYLIDRMVERS